jgi:hypothetical protein
VTTYRREELCRHCAGPAPLARSGARARIVRLLRGGTVAFRASRHVRKASRRRSGGRPSSVRSIDIALVYNDLLWISTAGIALRLCNMIVQRYYASL